MPTLHRVGIGAQAIVDGMVERQRIEDEPQEQLVAHQPARQGLGRRGPHLPPSIVQQRQHATLVEALHLARNGHIEGERRDGLIEQAGERAPARIRLLLEESFLGLRQHCGR